MGYLGRRIGLSQDKGDSNPGGADGAVGGGILNLFEQGYFNREGNIFNVPATAPTGLTASGGIISDYTDGSKVYRAHVFTSSGAFNVTETGSFPADIEYLVVAGGGAGGGRAGGGGGAGGLRTNLAGHPLAGSSYPVSTTNPYTVIVGGGGNGGLGDPGGNSQAGTSGGLSEFYPTPGGTGSGIKSNGGGGGAGCNGGTDASTGGSGGGGGAGNPNSKAAGNTPPTSPPQGNTGGARGGTFDGGGGGGAGGAGVDATSSAPGDKAGNGGLGVRVAIAGPSSDPSPIGATGPGSGASATGWFAGGGGGGNYVGSGSQSPVVIGYGGAGPSGTAPYAGAGNGSKTTPVVGDNGTFSTGGGGGGGGLTSPAPDGGSSGGNGGSGTVVIRYQIGTVNTSDAKASGGSVSFYNNKTIHVFTGSGEFTAPGSFNETLEYVIIGGGGAGGGRNYRGGGGGAGAVRHGTTAIDNTGPGNPSTTTVQVGAGGVYVAPEGPNGNGTSSFFGSPITSPGGGMGSGYETPYAGIPGGSGGGAGGYPSDNSGGTSSGDPFPGNPADTSPANGWGYDGGATTPGGNQQGGGGGGAGGLGIPQSKSASPTTYGYGGPGIQLPATFRDPRSAPGGTGGTGPHGPGVGGGLGYQSPGGTGWYVAGGGNGGGYSKPTGVNPSVNTFVPSGGGGRGAINGPGNAPEPEHPYRNNGWPGAVNSGSGGGGASPAYGQDPGQGGSGLVLIAYPT